MDRGCKWAIIDSIDIASEQENRNLSPIIKTIFCGKNLLLLIGHRDNGQINGTDESKEYNYSEWNFHQLRRFRIDAGDEMLKEHLKSSALNKNTS